MILSSLPFVFLDFIVMEVVSREHVLQLPDPYRLSVLVHITLITICPLDISHYFEHINWRKPIYA